MGKGSRAGGSIARGRIRFDGCFCSGFAICLVSGILGLFSCRFICRRLLALKMMPTCLDLSSNCPKLL